MSHSDENDFTTPSTIIGNLAHQLRQFSNHSRPESGKWLDAVGIINLSVLMESMSDERVRLSRADAQRYCREVLAVRDPHNRDVYEKAARGLSMPLRLTPPPAVQEQGDTWREARDAYRSASQEDIRDWRQAQQTPTSAPSDAGPIVETTRQADAAQTEDYIPCPQCKAPMEPTDARATQWRCPHPHGENGLTTWTG